jgi:hypothetical protein
MCELQCSPGITQHAQCVPQRPEEMRPAQKIFGEIPQQYMLVVELHLASVRKQGTFIRKVS